MSEKEKKKTNKEKLEEIEEITQELRNLGYPIKKINGENFIKVPEEIFDDFRRNVLMMSDELIDYFRKKKDKFDPSRKEEGRFEYFPVGHLVYMLKYFSDFPCEDQEKENKKDEKIINKRMF